MRIFLLPHHDDEVFLIRYLYELRDVTKSEKLHFIFMTLDSDCGLEKGIRRMQNSENSIRNIVGANVKITQLGNQLGILSRQILPNMSRIIEKFPISFSDCEREEMVLICPLPEYGHIDHIATALIALRLRSAVNNVDFYSTYRLLPWFRYSVQKLNVNSKTVGNNLRSLKVVFSLMKMYRSEWQTWIFLAPSLIWKIVIPNQYSNIFSFTEGASEIIDYNDKWEKQHFLKPKWRMSLLEYRQHIKRYF